MDDIVGLNWSSTPANGRKPTNTTSNYAAFSSLKPTPPVSGRASPLNPVSSQPPSKSTTPANDSFANLVPFTAPTSKNLSLLEQQRRQAEAKLQQHAVQHRNLSDQYGGGDERFWENLGSGRGTPTVGNTKNQTTNTRSNALDDDDDLFAAFNKPSALKTSISAAPSARLTAIEDEDDPFGLSEAGPRRADTTATTTALDEDEDVLGLLGKPAAVRPRRNSPPVPAKESSSDLHPQDKSVAELVDMGFPAAKARAALEATESGLDVQAAVGILLNQAHAEARQKTQSRNGDRQGVDGWVDSQPAKPRARWEDAEGPTSRPKPAATKEKDIEQMASEFGTNFLKTANSLWKQGTKRVQQAVQEFNSDSEGGGGSASSQPKWMREAAERQAMEKQDRQPRQRDVEPKADRRRQDPNVASQANMTDEALMLEGSRPSPPPRPAASSQRPDPRLDAGANSSRDHSPAMPSRLRESNLPSQPAFLRQQNQSPVMNSKATLSRAAAEEQAASAYVSSARRRKPQPALSSPPRNAVGSDLLASGSKPFPASQQRPSAPSLASKPTHLQPQPQSASKPIPSRPVQVRPPAPARPIPTINSIALKASHAAREKGNEHFKRGDYASAHQSYASSLSHLPETHPLTVILLTNHALTALKTGEPRSAIVDADKAISFIGPSKGEGETVTTGNGTVRPMRDYYGKALMRKAEALEQLEKWAEAAAVWREAVEGGHGGTTSIQGRMRAEKAANPQKPKPRPAVLRQTASAPPTAMRRPGASSLKPAEAVSRLRAANALADRVDDEKFRLSESIDLRITSWKSGKQDNLRALLGSLDQVLWEGSGWKKISMADLVLPGKVKVQYMKGIGKVHPDKIPIDATTEQRMIAGAVFSILNEAWDKFKTENGL